MQKTSTSDMVMIADLLEVERMEVFCAIMDDFDR
jgi:hypothetical protein